MNKHDRKAAAIVQAAFAKGEVLEARRTHDGAVMVSLPGRSAAAAATDAIVAGAAREAETEAQKEQQEAHRALSEEASVRLVKHRDAILRQLLNDMVAAGQLAHADPYGLDTAGILKGFTYEDGAIEYEVNGKVLVTFNKPTVAFDAEFMNIAQTYRVAL